MNLGKGVILQRSTDKFLIRLEAFINADPELRRLEKDKNGEYSPERYGFGKPTSETATAEELLDSNYARNAVLAMYNLSKRTQTALACAEKKGLIQSRFVGDKEFIDNNFLYFGHDKQLKILDNRTYHLGLLSLDYLEANLPEPNIFEFVDNADTFIDVVISWLLSSVLKDTKKNGYGDIVKATSALLPRLAHYEKDTHQQLVLERALTILERVNKLPAKIESHINALPQEELQHLQPRHDALVERLSRMQPDFETDGAKELQSEVDEFLYTLSSFKKELERERDELKTESDLPKIVLSYTFGNEEGQDVCQTDQLPAKEDRLHEKCEAAETYFSNRIALISRLHESLKQAAGEKRKYMMSDEDVQAEMNHSKYAHDLIRLVGGEGVLRDNLAYLKVVGPGSVSYDHKKVLRLAAVLRILQADQTGYFLLDSIDFEQTLNDLELIEDDRAYWLTKRDEELGLKENNSVFSSMASAVSGFIFESPKSNFISRIERVLDLLADDRVLVESFKIQNILNEELADQVIYRQQPQANIKYKQSWKLFGNLTFALSGICLALGVFAEGMGVGVLITPLLKLLGIHIVLAGTMSLLLANAAVCAGIGLIIGCLVSFLIQAVFGRTESVVNKNDVKSIITPAQKSETLVGKIPPVPSAITSIGKHAAQNSETEQAYQRCRRNSIGALPRFEMPDFDTLPTPVLSK